MTVFGAQAVGKRSVKERWMSHTAPRSGPTEQPAIGGRTARASVTARLDRIPVWPYDRKLLWIVGAGYFFAFFDIVTISFAAPVIATQSDPARDPGHRPLVGGGHRVGSGPCEGAHRARRRDHARLT